MNFAPTLSLSQAAPRLKKGDIGVIPTDTLYGVVASAALPSSVDRLYRVRERDLNKPCIVLLANQDDLGLFDISLSKKAEAAFRKFWPGKISVIFSGVRDAFSFLHRGTGTLAFRVPDHAGLRDMLRVSGPVIAPSANRQGEKPAETVEEAKRCFSDRVDFFVDGGTLSGESSTVVSFDGDRFTVVRAGAVSISSLAL